MRYQNGDDMPNVHDQKKIKKKSHTPEKQPTATLGDE